MLGVISACSTTNVEPADDGYYTRQSNGGEGWGTKQPDLSKGWLNRQIDKAIGKGGSTTKTSKENEELRARLERLENQQAGIVTSPSGDITAPPSGAYRAPSNVGGSNWQNSKSYQEWKQAREGGSAEYKEFQEYRDWLEFKKNKGS